MYPTERKRYIILGAAIGAVFLFFVVVMMLTQLRDGAQQLRDGIQEFADEGVQKISELVNGDVETLIDRINAMLDASRNYRTFSERPENMDGQVKFIYRTDEVK